MNNNENLNINGQNPSAVNPNNQPVNQNMQAQYPTAAPTSVQPAPAVDPMAAVASLNKEEAMEEALSHTNQYTPFEVPKQDVSPESKKGTTKSAYILIGVIVVIMALFILFLPQISKLFGW